MPSVSVPETAAIAPPTRPVAAPRAPERQYRDAVVTALLFAMALAIRLVAHSHNALSLDEANSVLIASHDGGGMLRALSQDGNPPVYYFLLHGWMSVFGDSEDAVRGLSIITGACLVPTLYLVGRRFLGPIGAVTAATVALIWPGHVEYSNYARMYALLPVLSLLFLYCLILAIETGPGRATVRWAAVGAAAVTLIWTHNYGMFVVAASPAVWWLWRPRSPGAGRCLSITLALVGLADLLWLPVVWEQSRSGVGDFVGAHFTPIAPLHSLLLFGAGYHVRYNQLTHFDTEGTGLFAIGWWAIAALGATWLALRDGRLRDRANVWLAMLLIPIAIPWIISLALHPIYLAGRYDIVAYPAFALLLGTGAEAMIWKWRAAPWIGRTAVGSLLAAYLALATTVLVGDANGPPDRMGEAMALAIAEHAAPGDVVITTGLTRAPLEYYERHLASALGLALHSIPASTDLHEGWFDFRAAVTDSAAVDSQVVTLVDAARKTGHSVIVVAEAGSGEMQRDIQILKEVLDARASSADLLMDYYADDHDRLATEQIVLYHLHR